MSIHNIDGEILAPTPYQDFADNSSIEHFVDSDTQTGYYLVRIFKQKRDGTNQFPFLYAPGGSGAWSISALAMNEQCKFPLIINAGVGSASGGSIVPRGVIIENGVLIQQGNQVNEYPLIIDNNGDLSYTEPNPDGATLVANGAISAICGFFPLVIDYEPVDASVYQWATHWNDRAQRQIIGQFANGDYAIITCDGRDFDNSNGWTIPEAITICIKHGLKFTYNLDGGGSTETVVLHKQINLVYENQTGRGVATYLVFNGSDTFSTGM